jgi:hypothetical protein
LGASPDRGAWRASAGELSGGAHFPIINKYRPSMTSA